MNLRDELLALIKENVRPYKITAASNEIMIRCPYCGDSQKSENHMHLYISIKDDRIFPFYCQKCNHKGIVNDNFLKDINCYNFTFMSKINKSAKEVSYEKHKKKYKSSFYHSNNKLILPSYNNKIILQKNKYNYLCDRYSFSLTPEEFVEKYKVVFSLKDFLRINNIRDISTNLWMLKNLHENYVGFLSNDQSYIIFRNIDPNCEKKYRYYNYKIFSDIENSNRLYIPKITINKLKPIINLVIAEGIFDIIGIKEYFYKNNIDNDTIFIAVNGKGYNLILNKIARMGFLSMNIFIYSDSDVNINFYKKLKKTIPCLKYNNTTVIYNSLEKDYGLKEDLIKLNYFKL
jgi:hypothetical protein